MPNKTSQLVEARRTKRLLRFTRRFEEGSVTGYVMDIGLQFFFLSFIDDRIRFNGFSVSAFQTYVD